jgi:hypothetical protein
MAPTCDVSIFGQAIVGNEMAPLNQRESRRALSPYALLAMARCGLWHEKYGLCRSDRCSRVDRDVTILSTVNAAIGWLASASVTFRRSSSVTEIEPSHERSTTHERSKQSPCEQRLNNA